MFAMFTRLTRDDGDPKHERLTRTFARRTRATARATASRASQSAFAPLALLISLTAAIVLIAAVSATGRGCRAGARAFRPIAARVAVCQQVYQMHGK